MARRFLYRARSRSGELLSGCVLAEDQMSAAAHIRGQDCFIVSLKEDKTVIGGIKNQLRGRQATSKNLAVFCRQLAVMLDAGVPILSSLEILMEQSGNPALQEALQTIYKRVREGEALSEILRSYPQIFPCVMVNLIGVGEITGALSQALWRLVIHFEKEHKLNETIKTAMIYPSFVLGTALAVSVFILVYVLPVFTQVLEDLHVVLPLATQILLQVGLGFQKYGLPLLCLLLLLLYWVKWKIQDQNVRRRLDHFILCLPLAGGLVREIAVIRFCRTFSMLLQGGVSLFTAIDVVGKALGNLQLERDLMKVKAGIRAGGGIARSLAAWAAVTPMLVQMVAVGEESGSLEQILEKTAEFYESEVEERVKRLAKLIEPLVIIFLGVSVGGLLLAVVLPMMDTLTNIGSM